jgi:hypothetical protein
MIIFDYIYYRTYTLYKDKWKEEDPKLYAVGVVSLLQEFNLGAILFFMFYYLEIKIERVYIFLFYVLLFIFNMLWYSKLKTRTLFQKWKVEGQKIRLIRGILVLLYVLISSVLFYKTAVFIGRIVG